MRARTAPAAAAATQPPAPQRSARVARASHAHAAVSRSTLLVACRSGWAFPWGKGGAGRGESQAQPRDIGPDRIGRGELAVYALWFAGVLVACHLAPQAWW